MAEQQVDMGKWQGESNVNEQQQRVCNACKSQLRGADRLCRHPCAGLFEWSMKYQDGKHGSGAAAQPLDPEKKAWWVVVVGNKAACVFVWYCGGAFAQCCHTQYGAAPLYTLRMAASDTTRR